MLKSVFSRTGFCLALCFFTTACYGADDLQGLGFGVGLGFRLHTGERDLVSDATIDSNGNVQVNTRNNTAAGLVLEMHHYAKTFKKDSSGNGTFGIGPFVAVQSGTDQVISAAGAGIMFGWRIPSGSMSNKAFGLGVGYSGLPSAKVMVPGFIEGKKPPYVPTDSSVPLQQRDTGAFLFVLSLNFK